MPFGAHEAMEVHEILTEKINMINHFHMYAAQAKNPQLKEMIHRHLQEEIKSYDAVVSYTHDYQNFAPMPANTNIRSAQPDQIQYGLDNPSMVAPEANTTFNDFEIASALLICHKNGAANGVKATLEIADPNLRQVLLNGAVNCVNQAYEVFLFMNSQGQYQIPTMKDHTAKTYLHAFQPSSESLKAQYMVNPGQSQGADQAMMGNMMGNAPMNQQMNQQNHPTNQQMNQPMYASKSGQHLMPTNQVGGIPAGAAVQQQHQQAPTAMYGQMMTNQPPSNTHPSEYKYFNH